jgi:exonuclease SbcD
MKILHTADWHLREKDIDEAEKCLNFLVETARSEKVDLIINAGDTFDSQEIKLDSKAARLAVRIVSELADIAPVVIIIGTSSHDGKSPEILQFAKGIFPVHVSAVPEQVYFIKDGNAFRESGEGYSPQAIITMIPQPAKQFFQTNSGIADSDQEIGQAMSGLFSGFGVQAEGFDCPHILIGHFNMSGAMLSNGQVRTGMDIEVSVEQMMFARPDIVCLGHIHKSQRLGAHTYYSGSLYHQNWGELEAKGFFIHEFIEEELTSSRFIETPAKKLLRLQEDFTADVGHMELDAVLYSYGREELSGAYIRCDFTVWQDQAEEIDKEKIKEFFLSAGTLDVDIRIIRVPRQNVRSEAVLKADRLRDKIQKMAELKGEQVEWSVLMKAELLEDTMPDELIAAVGGAI